MGSFFSQFYTPPEKKGDYPYTRSGIAPPKILKKSGSDQPSHRINDPMSLEMHMADQRTRTAGMSDAEREWRRKWVQDQNLHSDEPIHVDAVHRQLNPIRILYRYPWDTLYRRFLQPTFGTYTGGLIRVGVPKLVGFILFFELIYYQWKYTSKSWQRQRGVDTITIPPHIDDPLGIDRENPGIMAEGMPDPAKYRYFSRTWAKRTTHFDVGETTRPY